MDLFQEYGEVIVAVLVVLIIVQWLTTLSVSRKLKKLRKSYTEMMGTAGVDNLEAIIIDMKREEQQQHEKIAALQDEVKVLKERLPKMKSKVAIRRYNAFSDTGSDLSFSLAIMNEEKDGVVLTSIHSREGAYMYAKPIEHGVSKYTLTPEEVKVIDESK